MQLALLIPNRSKNSRFVSLFFGDNYLLTIKISYLKTKHGVHFLDLTYYTQIIQLDESAEFRS